MLNLFRDRSNYDTQAVILRVWNVYFHVARGYGGGFFVIGWQPKHQDYYNPALRLDY